MNPLMEKFLIYAISAVALTGCGRDIYDGNKQKLELKADKAYLNIKKHVTEPVFTALRDKKKAKMTGFDVIYHKGPETLFMRTAEKGNKIVFLNETDSVSYARKDSAGMEFVTSYYQHHKKTDLVVAPDGTEIFRISEISDINNAVPIVEKFINAGNQKSLRDEDLVWPGYYRKIAEDIEKEKNNYTPFSAYKPF